MTLSEFKAWFEGYTEGLEAAPTKAQFDRIKEKVKLIDGTPTTRTVYVDRYVGSIPHGWPSWTGSPHWNQPYLGGVSIGQAVGGMQAGATGGSAKIVDNLATAQGQSYVAAYSNNYAPNGFKTPDSVTAVFDAQAAMYALGKAEAMN